ncbi:hypothetical protein [Syntrophomonas palmitatica]|uniref:hypothetical protein n=1 Tax=Syntrophomonas palmitatica TaxID=402877 RepID=UPI0006D088BB|nr:hypothetical protein [Syntrophomonas palmitatica]
MGKKSQVIALLILMFFVITSCINPIPIQAADTYTIPNGVDQNLHPALNSKIQANMDVILKRVDTDMNNLVEPLIPQISSMVAQKTSDMGGKINKIGIDTIQPSLKAHVEEQAQIIKNEVNNIVMNAVMQAGPQSDPSSLIRSALVSALPQLKQDTITRADQEQRKEMETVRPLIEAVIQEEMTALLPDIQNLVLAKLQEGVPATKRAVDADIDAMISELQSSLPDEQKKLMEQMRPQFEAKARPQISEELFDAVAVKIDQKVVSGIETVNKESIKLS